MNAANPGAALPQPGWPRRAARLAGQLMLAGLGLITGCVLGYLIGVFTGLIAPFFLVVC